MSNYANPSELKEPLLSGHSDKDFDITVEQLGYVLKLVYCC